MLVQRPVPQRLGVPFECAVVVQVGVTLRDVWICMVADDVLVVPSERRREQMPVYVPSALMRQSRDRAKWLAS